MTLPILKINFSQIGNNWGTLGFDYIVGALKDSPLFNVQDHKDEVKTVKGQRGTILYFNDKKIYLDFWEYYVPSHSNEALAANFDLIIRLQHRNIEADKYVHFANRKNIFGRHVEDKILTDHWNKMIPWTFFPSKNMMPYIGKEHELTSLPIQQLGFFCGFNWKCRHSMKKKLESDGIRYVSREKDGNITDEEFLKLMRSSKFGIILPGRNTFITDSKNRREIDYMMARKPILMSYRPYYYDPLIDGKHYIYIDEKTNLNELENKYNIEQMAEDAFQWYQRNASPSGIASSFLKIMTDKGYIKESI